MQMLLALEWYYGYASPAHEHRYLYLTYPTADWSDKPLNSSPFITHIPKVVPGYKWKHFGYYALGHIRTSKRTRWFYCCKKSAGIFCKAKNRLKPMISRLSQQWCDEDSEVVPQSVLKILIGNLLKISVSGLEDYAACPFKYL